MSIRKGILLAFLCIGFTYLLSAQSVEKFHKKASVDLMVSGGSLSILDPEHKNKTYISGLGSFESSRGYFFETGIEFTKELKRNSLKTGLYYGYSNVTIRGAIPTYSILINIFIDPFPTNLEEVADSFEAQVRVNRLSIPISFIKESYRPSKFKIDHEFGVLLDVKMQSNFADIEKEIFLVPDFIISSNSKNESKFSLPTNIGCRVLYGISAELSPKLSMASSLRFGLFEPNPDEANRDVFNSLTQADRYMNFDGSVFGYFEMGFSLKYKLSKR